MSDKSIDLVLTSPPYCTRLDYITSTQFEIDALAYSRSMDELLELRRSAMGTPLTRQRELPEVRASWPRPVRGLLQAIRNHSSADSASYYFKNFWQYFDDADRSVRELRRVLKSEGLAMLVLQTSYYKDIHVDLPSLYQSIARVNGFRTATLLSRDVSRVMTQINPRANKHLADRCYAERIIALIPA